MAAERSWTGCVATGWIWISGQTAILAAAAGSLFAAVRALGLMREQSRSQLQTRKLFLTCEVSSRHMPTKDMTCSVVTALGQDCASR